MIYAAVGIQKDELIEPDVYWIFLYIPDILFAFSFDGWYWNVCFFLGSFYNAECEVLPILCLSLMILNWLRWSSIFSSTNALLCYYSRNWLGCVFYSMMWELFSLLKC
jgi:hypothetical protein